MKLSEARDIYYDRSGLASSSARQLAFAGIGIVWVLSTEGVISPQALPGLRLPLLVFVVALALDLLQYYGASLMWGCFHRYKEKKGEEEFSGAPDWVNWPANVGFWGKGLSVAIGYVILFQMLWPVLFRTT